MEDEVKRAGVGSRTAGPLRLTMAGQLHPGLEHDRT
jgi:hypothetical protein